MSQDVFHPGVLEIVDARPTVTSSSALLTGSVAHTPRHVTIDILDTELEISASESMSRDMRYSVDADLGDGVRIRRKVTP